MLFHIASVAAMSWTLASPPVVMPFIDDGAGERATTLAYSAFLSAAQEPGVPEFHSARFLEQAGAKNLETSIKACHQQLDCLAGVGRRIDVSEIIVTYVRGASPHAVVRVIASTSAALIREVDIPFEPIASNVNRAFASGIYRMFGVLANGELAVKDLPDGAIVFVDGGVVLINRPLVMSLGYHQVSIDAPGFDSWKDDVLVHPNQITVVRPQLKSISGLDIAAVAHPVTSESSVDKHKSKSRHRPDTVALNSDKTPDKTIASGATVDARPVTNGTESGHSTSVAVTAVESASMPAVGAPMATSPPEVFSSVPPGLLVERHSPYRVPWIVGAGLTGGALLGGLVCGLLERSAQSAANRDAVQLTAQSDLNTAGRRAEITNGFWVASGVLAAGTVTLLGLDLAHDQGDHTVVKLGIDPTSVTVSGRF